MKTQHCPWVVTGLAVLVQALTLGSASVMAQTAALKLYWSGTSLDNFSTATAQGEADALAAGYRFIRNEAYVFTSPQPGTIPLKLYWEPVREDNMVIGALPWPYLQAAGYSFIRVEGYVYPTPQPNTVPLKTYESPGHTDMFTTATAQGEADALAAGYTFWGIEGYALATRPTSTALKVYWDPARGDNFSTATAQGEADALAAGYRFVRSEAYPFTAAQPGTVPLNLFWSPKRGDNFVTATAQGEADARAAGYSFIRTEGHVYPTSEPNTVPLKLYWSQERNDNFTTASAQGEVDALAAGYSFIRIEGYVPAGPASLSINLASDLGAGHFMTTEGVMLQNGYVDAQTQTRTVTWFGGFRGGVQVFFEDAGGITIGASQVQIFGVDGSAVGRNDRTDGWSEDIDPSLAAQTTALHVQHFSGNPQAFEDLVSNAVAAGRPVVDLINDIKSAGGDAK